MFMFVVVIVDLSRTGNCADSAVKEGEGSNNGVIDMCGG
jgi:hypothetical protein